MSARNRRFHLSPRRWAAVIAALALLGLLTQVPYTALREERLRAFGETRTEGEVLELAARPSAGTDSAPVCLVEYRFIDGFGRSLVRVAPVRREVWDRLRPGDSITVWYATGLPPVSRVEGQLEPAWRARLRRWLSRNGD